METQRIARVIIVDDDKNATALLKRMLEAYSVEIVGTASDANSTARQLILEKEPDLLFLDVELPSMLGLEFYTQIRPYAKPEMAVVFYTGYDKYMLEATQQPGTCKNHDQILRKQVEQHTAHAGKQRYRYATKPNDRKCHGRACHHTLPGYRILLLQQ